MKTRLPMHGDMIRAVLRGEKTVTRRVLVPQPPHGCWYEMNGAGGQALCMARIDGERVFVPPTARSRTHQLSCPYGAPGSVLKLTEAIERNESGRVRYVATDTHTRIPWPAYWKRNAQAAMYVPAEFARLTATIVSLGVGRVQDVDAAEAVLEGVPQGVERYRERWNQINNGRGYGWAVNPWVWRIEFKVALRVAW